MKRNPIKTWHNKVKVLYSLYIRKRDGKCVVCGSRDRLQNGHFFSHVSQSTRYNDLNCNTQCSGCNYLHEHDTYPYTRWFIKKYGLAQYDRLHNLSKRTKKYTLKELKELYEEIKLKFDLLE